MEGGCVEIDLDDASDAVQIHIVGEEGGTRAPGDSHDHAIDHAPRRNACRTAAAIDTYGAVEVRAFVEPRS
jgi:hypothetical protein